MDSVKTLSIISALQSYRYSYATEKDFQKGIEHALQNAFIPYRREERLGEFGIIDFIAMGVGIECKIKGTRHALQRQLSGYTKSSAIESIVVASANRAIISAMPETLNGKIIRTVFLGSALS